MKRMIGILAVVGLCALSAQADSYTYTYSLLGYQTNVSAAIPVSGILDKVEIAQDAGRTTAVTVASYSADDTAMETYVYLSALTDAAKVVRPRFIGTSYTGTALAAAATTTASYYSTLLMAQYEKPLIGGNTKIMLVGDANAPVTLTNNITVVVHYQPLKK